MVPAVTTVDFVLGAGMRPLLAIQAWLLALAMMILWATCRVRVHNDPRKKLKAAGIPYAFSILHAHQVSAAINREPGTAAMVSQSDDGALLVPGFWALRIKVIRGSSGGKQKRDKGGRAALKQLTDYVQTGHPAYLAVDGPRGPRNHVRKGIAVLSREADAAVLNVCVIAQRRWILSGIWDRLQIPKPFTRIDGYFAEPLMAQQGESIEQYRRRIEASLNDLEIKHDPAEAAYQPEDAESTIAKREVAPLKQPSDREAAA